MNSFEETLRAVIGRIIPADEHPGALELETDRFVLAHLSATPHDSELVIEGLAALENHAMASDRASFSTLALSRQDALLETIAEQPWFNRLVTLVSEGFYADPDNGGNAGAQSWAMIGYEHRLPEGPSGPPARSDLASRRVQN